MKYKIDGVIYDPILMGDVDDFYEACDKDTCCTDCGAHMGEQHLNGCDCERCPKCLGQIISCSCHDSDIEEINNMNNNMNNLYDVFENYNNLGIIRPIKDGEFIGEDVCPDCGHPLIPISTSRTTLDMLEQTAHCDHCNKDFIECFTLHFIGYKEDITYEEN